VQDDWSTLEWCRQGSFADLLRNAFDPTGKLLYRPLTAVYLRVMHALFGFEARAHHLVAIVLLAAGAMLARRVLREFTKDRLCADLAALSYVAVALVHHEAVVWGVGIQDVAAPAAILGVVLAGLCGRFVVSAVLLALGLTCKEGAVIAVPLLVVALVARDGRWALRPRALLRLWPHALVGVAFVAAKLRGADPFALPGEHPYSSALIGGHVPENALRYAAWTAEALFPGLPQAAAGGLIVVLASGALLAAEGDAPRGGRGGAWLLVAWTSIALAPFLALRHHAYRAYLGAAMPAAAGLAWIGLHALARRATGSERAARGAVVVAALLGIAASAYSVRELTAEPGPPRRWGTNQLVAKARFVSRLRPAIAAASLPRGAVLVLEGMDTAACGESSGPRLWTGDATLRVLDERQVRREPDGSWLAAGEAGSTRLDPRLVRWVEQRDGQVWLRSR
jgi:hypothetical protein